MAAKQEPGEFLVDGLGEFDAGMNAGLAPQLIPTNQVSMATNMTFRGGYGTHRPPVREITLDFKGNAALEELCTRRTFQGACFYQPDTGPQALVASIGGHLMEFFPSGSVASVADVSVPNDFNSSTLSQSWLWQCERFIILNNGVNLPVFFDGTFSRRSNGDGGVLATIVGTFHAPAVGATIDVTVTALYTGPVNVPVLVDGEQYILLSAGGGGGGDSTSMIAAAIYDPQTQRNIGDPIVVYPNRNGTLLTDIPAGSLGLSVVMVVELIATNQVIEINNCNFRINSITTGPTIGIYPTVLVHIAPLATGNPAIPSGSIITRPGVSTPPTPVGTVGAPFVPTGFATGTPIVVNPTYTGPIQFVWIGDGHYTATPKTPGPPANTTVTLQNVGATAGDAMNGDIISLAELPAGRMGTYGLGRNWMALPDGFSFIASDIDGGTSGTPVYDFRDAPLRVTENTYLAGGGTFRVPGAVGDIRAMQFAATLDVSLGQGPLQVFTPLSAFSCNAPVDRTTWTTITNPILTQSLLGAGAVSQSGTVLDSGDIIFRAIDGIRSLILARRDFDTWGNVPQSREVQPIINQDDSTLIQFESLVQFDNRLLLTVMPTQGPLGIYHKGIIALNEDLISTLRGKAPSVYDGFWTGLNIFQLVTGVFNSVQRCYAFCFDSFLNRMRLFEIQTADASTFDNGNIPITFSFESAALFNNPKIKSQFDLIELMDGEIYVSDLRGVVNFQTWYRSGISDCWTPWLDFSVCNNNTDDTKPLGYRNRLGLGSPDVNSCDPNTEMPRRIGNTFQFRIQITGDCKFRGAKFMAKPVPQTKFSVPKCQPLCDGLQTQVDCEACVDNPDCLKFPLVFYNLNANKTYTNDAIVASVVCGDGRVQPVPVPAGTVSYTLPFPPNYDGDYPPLIMNCLGGGVIVKTLPKLATQSQIDEIVNEMILLCVNAYAESIADCS